MSKRSILFFCIFFLLSELYAGEKGRPAVLIYTKNGEGYVHDNIAACTEALLEICRRNGIDAVVSDSPTVFTQERLSQFHAVIFANTNNTVFDDDEQRLAFMRYIKAGGGMMGIHSASGTERRWPWFQQAVGGAFLRHPPLQEFEIKVIDRSHPATEPFGGRFRWEDECYFHDRLNPDIHVLMAVDLRTLKDNQLDRYPGKVFGDYFPLAWCHEYDGGRQFYTALGHKIEHYRIPQFVRHLEAGLLWTISGDRSPDYRKAADASVELLPAEGK